VAQATGLSLHAGRMVWELRPAVELNKATVITRLSAESGAGHIVYVGDDVTDRTVFRMLAQRPENERLAVGVWSQEAPPETFAECDLLLDGVTGVAAMLNRLLTLPD
jgi:trehalose 6-phosphate phosphatase